MSRLFDRLLASGNLAQFNQRAQEGIRSATVISIDNVAQYLYQVTDQEEWNFLEDFPNVAPPLQNMFFDVRAPGHINSRDHGWQKWPGPKYYGFHFFSHDVAPTTKYPNLKWAIEATLFMEFEKYNPIGPLARMQLYINKDGAFAEHSRDCALIVTHALEHPHWDKMPKWLAERALGEQRSFLFPCLLAISFMHCKNVEMLDIEPSLKLSKKFQKKRGRSLVRYHVLKIDPIKKVLATQGGSETSGIQRALHICRGHFKDYRQSGLFGKVPGIFWWGSYVRGQKERGIVLKDYEVEGPSA